MLDAALVFVVGRWATLSHASLGGLAVLSSTAQGVRECDQCGVRCREKSPRAADDTSEAEQDH
jgi:hypothetical protein